MVNEKYYLGKLCHRNHDYKTTGKSLRYKSNYYCVECKKITSNEKKQNGPYLGTLCKRNHNYNDTDKSLRNAKGNCIECEKINEKNRSKRKRIRKKKNKLPREKVYIGDYYLGKLCPKGHEHENTGKTLRNKQWRCIKCERLSQKKYYNIHKKRNQKNKPGPNKKERFIIDGIKCYLGNKCRNNHTFEDTNKTLRYDSGVCIECSKNKSKVRTKKMVENIDISYAKKKLKMTGIDIPKELVALKQLTMSIRRELKNVDKESYTNG